VPPLTAATSGGNGFHGGRQSFRKDSVHDALDRQGQLSSAQEAEILAYILKVNRYPAGGKELPSDAEQLRVVRFEADKVLQ